MALPTPIGRQREVLVLPASGHTVVLGTAGSGKTTLAILRSAYLANPRTDHGGRTLLVTFNRALVTYLRHLGDPTLGNVLVENYHKFARGYLKSRRKMSKNAICTPDERDALLTELIDAARRRHPGEALFELPRQILSDEMRWLAQQGIDTFDAYTGATPRSGMRSRFRSGRDKAVMWAIVEEYREFRSARGKQYDWDDIATAVCRQLDADTIPRRYRHVVIDEGQDFSPEMIRSLTKVVPPDGSVTFFGDVAQQIYGHRTSWRSAGLNIRKVWEFQENYRNTKQIADLALAISAMPYFRGVPDLVAPVAPTAAGPLPTVVKCTSREDQVRLLVEQARQRSRTQSVAVLVRTRADEDLFSARLPKGAIRLHRDMTTWRAGPGIYYGTYHAAKGLEFDAVILPFLSDDRLPDPDTVDTFGTDEARVQDGRLLYVGVTRARTWLILTYTGTITDLLPFDPALYTSLEIST